MNEYFESENFIDQIWNTIVERQQSLNKQMDESLDKLSREREQGNRLMEESEKKYFRRVDKKNLEMKELDDRIHKQLEENKLKVEEHRKEEEEKSGKLFKGKKAKRKARNRGTSEDSADIRYDDYSDIYNAISVSSFEDEEKQALIEAVSGIQQKFNKPAEGLTEEKK